MAGGKGKSTGGKAGPKEAAGKSQKSHSAKAGLQVSIGSFADVDFGFGRASSRDQRLLGRARAGVNQNIFPHVPMTQLASSDGKIPHVSSSSSNVIYRLGHDS